MLDLKILNSILFIFDLEVAQKIVQRACCALDKKYPSIKWLKASFLTNYCYLLMINNELSEAITYIKRARITAASTGRYDLVVVADVRKLYLEQDENWKSHIEEKYKLFDEIGLDDVIIILKNEQNNVLKLLNK